MNWDAIGAVGEILGALAVFLSLAYLAIQTRQNTQALRSAAFHQVRDSFAEVSLVMAQSPELVELLARAIRNEDLTFEEELQVSFIFTTIARKGESAYFQANEGTLQQESWLGIRSTVVMILSSLRGLAWLDTTGDRFTSNYISDIKAEALKRRPANGGSGT